MDNYRKFGAFAILISTPPVVGALLNQGQGIIFGMGIFYGLIFVFHSRVEKAVIPKIKEPLIFYGICVFCSGMFIETLAYLSNLKQIKAGEPVYLFSPNFTTDVFIRGLPHYLLIAVCLSLLIRRYYFSVFELGFVLWLFWAIVVDQFSHLEALMRGNALDFTMAGLLLVFGLHWPILIFHNSLNEAYPRRSRHWLKYPVAFLGLFLSAIILTGIVFRIQGGIADAGQATLKASESRLEKKRSGIASGVPVEKLGVKIPMRDGRRLAADVILPATDGKFSAIYVHTPYKRENVASPLPDSPFVRELLDREHYAYVATDWRGFFGSKEAGEGVKAPTHGKDGYDAIEWIAKQPWSNGKVGMWGHSAPGSVQFQIAFEKPPHLVCAVPASGATGAPYQQFYYGGVPEGAYFDFVSAVGHDRYGGVFRAAEHPTYDNVWKLAEFILERQASADIPMLFITGWYDTHPGIKLDAFNRVRTNGKQHDNDMKLIVGPWHHSAFGRIQQGALEFPEAEGLTSRETLRFFDYYLRDQKENGWDQEPPVRYFQMGENRWKTAAAWPPETSIHPYYFRAGGKLSTEKPADEKSDGYDCDPKDPCPTVGGANLDVKEWKNTRLKKLSLDAGPRDLREKVESRKDVLLYTTDELSTDVRVAGDIRVKLHVASTGADTDFAIRLSDVYPDGRSMLVTDGIQRMSFRESIEHPTAIQPGRIYEVPISLVPVAQTFLKGHRIRLIVSSSNHPRFAVNSNRFGQAEAFVAKNTVYHDVARPSALLLPVVGADK